VEAVATFRTLLSIARQLLRPLAAVLLGMVALPSLPAATFVVTNRNDSGAGSFRQAILNANSNAGADRITFSIPGTPPLIISPTAALPPITGTVAIDGTTQPGFAGAPLVALSDGQIVGTANGLTLQAPGCEVRGLAISRFRGSGVLINSSGNIVAGNFIGVTAAGTAALGNALAGITIQGAANNVIGGTNAADRNVISGNDYGIFVTGFGSSGNVIAGNLIGTDVTGTLDVGNTNHGVLFDNVSGNWIGGTIPGARNVISGNNRAGVYLNEALTTGNQVAGNYIGTDITGTAGIANETNGIVLQNATANVIGGTTPGAGNLISANGERGILFQGTLAQGNRVEGNVIGLSAHGTNALPNRSSGIGLIAASFNVIGGTNATARNVISGNLQSGVAVHDAQCTGNSILGNFIGTDVSGTRAAGNNLSGITVAQGTNNIIGGTAAGSRNVISGNALSGVYVVSGSGTVLAGNFIGTDATGSAGLRNVQGGIRIDGPGNTIGGSSPSARNVISGNGIPAMPASGVVLFGAAASNNVVAGNFIGTDASGTAAIPNAYAGVGLTNAPRNVIGGAGPFEGNVISGNANSGIYLAGTGATRNRIEGNRIGTSTAGTSAVANGGGGIYLYGSPTNQIGGAAPHAGNLISGNSRVGISIGDAGAGGSTVMGNWIGWQANGSSALANQWHGVEVTNVSAIIGGPNPGEGNRIGNAATSGYDGVRVRAQTTGVRVRGNAMSGNGGSSINGLGIDLDTDGVSANDNGDGDGGANGLQNFPVITSVTGRFICRIEGTLNSRANQTFTVDFHGNAANEDSGFGEGERWLGAISVTTGGGGNVSFSATLTNLFGAGSWITATATDANGNTSEFARIATIVPAPDSDGDGLSDDYEAAAGLNPANGSDASTDADGDGHAAQNEFVAGTDPQLATDVFRLTVEPRADGNLIRFTGKVGRLYRVDAANQVDGPWTTLGNQVAGTGAAIRLVDPQGVGATRFYRAQVTSN
jgi:titin